MRAKQKRKRVARGPKRRAPRRSSRAKARKTSGVFRKFLFVAVLLSMALGFALSVVLVRLDKVVRFRFEGQLFRVPSRVLAAPTILYPGLNWRHIALPETLRHLGYREETGRQSLAVGRYRWGKRTAAIYLRSFEHPTRAEVARNIVLNLEGPLIGDLRDADTGRELGAVLLEPELVGAYYGPDREQRELARLDEMPEHLIDAVLAVEDKRFLDHPGLDLRRIGGALLTNIRAGGVRQGASTLTQQLVKNFFLTPERTLKRKLHEALMALLVEVHYSKAEILEAYLNEIYLGQRGSTAIHGVGEASHLYFGKSVSTLTTADSALLAAIIQSPNGISPFRHSDKAVERRNLVLDLMHKQKRISEATLKVALAEPLQVAQVTQELNDARYFLELLRRQLPGVYDAEHLTSEGLLIYSTLDLRLQRIAAKVLRDGLEDLERRYPRLVSSDKTKALQGCVIAMRPQTGEILALAGGRDYGVSQFDRCTQAHRPTGSVFKPFVYLAALERQGQYPVVTLADFLEDTPLLVSTPSGPWEPLNYDEKFNGMVTVREAIERSLNVATARLAQEVGIDRVADVARRAGITSHLPRVPSLALGTADISPIEVARAYASLANGGVRSEIRSFEDVVNRGGITLERGSLRFDRVFEAGPVYLVTSLLEGVVDRGTARSIRRAGILGPVAGKTGTTDEGRDTWFAGYTPELVVVVWVGFDEPRGMGLTGSSAALPIWRQFLSEATGGTVRGAFLPPTELVALEIDPRTGARALGGCPEHRLEYFLPGTEPTRICDYRGVRDADPRDDFGPKRYPDPGRSFLDWLSEML